MAAQRYHYRPRQVGGAPQTHFSSRRAGAPSRAAPPRTQQTCRAPRGCGRRRTCLPGGRRRAGGGVCFGLRAPRPPSCPCGGGKGGVGGLGCRRREGGGGCSAPAASGRGRRSRRRAASALGFRSLSGGRRTGPGTRPRYHAAFLGAAPGSGFGRAPRGCRHGTGAAVWAGPTLAASGRLQGPDLGLQDAAACLPLACSGRRRQPGTSSLSDLASCVTRFPVSVRPVCGQCALQSSAGPRSLSSQLAR